MPREKIAGPSTEGRYAQVSWRRLPGLDSDDQGTAPGYVQLSVHSPEVPAGEFTDLDEAGIDQAIKALHKAKNQAYGESMAAKADRAIKTWRKGLDEGADPAAARAKVWADFGYSDEEIAHIEAAIGEITAVPQPIRFKTPEVTVESDASAAARLDTDRYRATRRGDR